MSGEHITRAIMTTDGKVLIEQPDGSYRLAESQTDWARLDAMTEEEVEQYYRAHPEEFTRGGQLISYQEAAPLARERAAALRRATLVAQWLRDLSARAEVAENR